MAHILCAYRLQTSTMKFNRLVPALLIAGLLFGCDNTETTGGEKDPAEVHPPSEAIPDSTKIVGDSVIVPDTVPDTDKKAGSQDSVTKQ